MEIRDEFPARAIDLEIGGILIITEVMQVGSIVKGKYVR